MLAELFCRGHDFYEAAAQRRAVILQLPRDGPLGYVAAVLNPSAMARRTIPVDQIERTGQQFSRRGSQSFGEYMLCIGGNCLSLSAWKCMKARKCIVVSRAFPLHLDPCPARRPALLRLLRQSPFQSTSLIRLAKHKERWSICSECGPTPAPRLPRRLRLRELTWFLLQHAGLQYHRDELARQRFLHRPESHSSLTRTPSRDSPHHIQATTNLDHLIMDNSPLRKLPPELRIVIWELAMVSTSATGSYHKKAGPAEIALSLLYDEDRRDRERLQKKLTLTLVCRQIREEAFPVFYASHSICMKAEVFTISRAACIFTVRISGPKPASRGVPHGVVALQRWLTTVGPTSDRARNRIELYLDLLERMAQHIHVTALSGAWKRVHNTLLNAGLSGRQGLRVSFALSCDAEYHMAPFTPQFTCDLGDLRDLKRAERAFLSKLKATIRRYHEARNVALQGQEDGDEDARTRSTGMFCELLAETMFSCQ